MPELILIAGLCRDRGIGLGNELLLRVPQDMAHFKALTMGHPVLMGRKTWDSIPERFRPLAGRRNLVLTRQTGLSLPGAEVHHSVAAALQACADAERVYVMGGAELYAQTLSQAHALELTEFDAIRPADAFFPPFAPLGFTEVSRRTLHPAADDTLPCRLDFVRYERKS